MTPYPRAEVTKEPEDTKGLEKLVAPQNGPRHYRIDIVNAITFSYFHLSAIYGLYLCITEARWYTIVSALILHQAALLGIIVGAHRLWSHRAFKANLPLQILLMIFQSLSCENTIYHWAVDHRLHHKFTDTDADPHNSARGLFFSHMGWLLVKKHPEASKRLRTVDLSDLKSNPVVMFQRKHEIPVIATIALILPTVTPMFFWGETFRSAWNIAILRIILSWHMTFLINSFAHAVGMRPYDKSISSTQSMVINALTSGAGFHNYHHAFPWDYRASELGDTIHSFHTMFIDFFARIGWAYELKTTSKEAIARRVERTGDALVWGWEDDMPKEHKEVAQVLNTVTE